MRGALEGNQSDLVAFKGTFHPKMVLHQWELGAAGFPHCSVIYKLLVVNVQYVSNNNNNRVGKLWDSSRHVEVRKERISEFIKDIPSLCHSVPAKWIRVAVLFRKIAKVRRTRCDCPLTAWGGTYLAQQKPGVLFFCFFSYLHSIHRMQPFCLSFWKQKHYFYTNILYIRTRRNECQKCLNYFKH